MTLCVGIIDQITLLFRVIPLSQNSQLLNSVNITRFQSGKKFLNLAVPGSDRVYSETDSAGVYRVEGRYREVQGIGRYRWYRTPLE